MPVALVIGLVLLLPADAFAYIDPGTGSLIYQTFLAALLGLGFVFRSVWFKVGTFLLNLFRRGSVPPEDDPQSR